jgi:hypothetical protein
MAGLEDSRDGEYLTDRLTSEAEKFITANRERPFFLYLSHYAVHTPLKAKEALIQQFLTVHPTGGQTNAIYAAMIESLDESVGRIVKKLQELNLSRQTIIFFTSDNGGLATKEGPNTPATSNAPLREGKGYLYEGGIRVPLVVWSPGALREGVVERAPVSSVDFFPTILAMAGVEARTGLDGVDLLPLLKGQAPLKRDALFWHYPHYSNQGGKPCGAVREGDLKLIQFFEDGRLELYNLRDDLGENHNLAPTLTSTSDSLRTKLKTWRKSLDAQMMDPNPDYDGSEAAPGDKRVRQMADGLILLHARDAAAHGTGVRYEPQPFKNTLGYWTNAQDWVSWEFQVNEPGLFSVQILQGCGNGSGGSEVVFSVDEQKLTTIVQETGGFQNFLERDLGQFRLDHPGIFTLAVHPKSKPGLAVMDLRSVLLKPANRP